MESIWSTGDRENINLYYEMCIKFSVNSNLKILSKIQIRSRVKFENKFVIYM